MLTTVALNDLASQLYFWILITLKEKFDITFHCSYKFNGVIVCGFCHFGEKKYMLDEQWHHEICSAYSDWLLIDKNYMSLSLKNGQVKIDNDRMFLEKKKKAQLYIRLYLYFI